jgi:GH25 family lysozyme M1 (1,4-beta-N-acetylmuramidase)
MAATSRGIDVSSYQGAQDWAALARGGLTFAFVKASEGEHTRADRYRMHMDGILSVASLLPGAYHYAHPNQDAHAEADNYVGAVRADAERVRGFTHWLDLERAADGSNYAGRTSAQIRAWAEAWIERVQAAFPRQRVGVYTSAADIAAGRCPRNAAALWYPAYPAGPLTFTQAEQRSRPAPSGMKPLIWQFASSPTDRSIAYMTPAALAAWAGHQEDDMPTAKEIAAEVISSLMNGKVDDPTTSDDSQVTWRGMQWTTGMNAGQANANTRKILAQLAAQSAAITALAGQLGKNADTAAVVAAVQEAIADAVVHVEVTGVPAAESAQG